VRGGVAVAVIAAKGAAVVVGGRALRILVVVTEVIDVDFVAGDLVVESMLDKAVVSAVLLEIAVNEVAWAVVDGEMAMLPVVSLSADSLVVAWVRTRGGPNSTSSRSWGHIVEK
jgi:hypothetical protein